MLIQDKIEDFVSEEVLKGTILENTDYVLYVDEKEVKLKTTKTTKKIKKKKFFSKMIKYDTLTIYFQNI
jgi:hypothetical protein